MNVAPQVLFQPPGSDIADDWLPPGSILQMTLRLGTQGGQGFHDTCELPVMTTVFPSDLSNLVVRVDEGDAPEIRSSATALTRANGACSKQTGLIS